MHSRSYWDSAADPIELFRAQVLCVAEPHLVTIAEDRFQCGVR
jgi:hypothetical protein